VKSTAELAAEQAAYWNGPGGQGWLAAYARIERGMGGFTEALFAGAKVKAGEQVIDIGCGTGGTTAELARAVAPGGHVTGLDISGVLINAARERRVDNATFVVGDAATHPFTAQSCDLVFSRFGVMFFAEPVTAFANFRRALKPDGRLVFLCWRPPQENPWATASLRAAQPFLPPLQRPGPEDPGQFSFGDRARVERILKEAGFVRPAIEPVDRPVFLGATIAEIVEGAGRFGPLARAFANAEPAAIEKAKVAIGEALKSHLDPTGVVLPGACWLVTARVG
jgi:SAM-dependent methyltransferase